MSKDNAPKVAIKKFLAIPQPLFPGHSVEIVVRRITAPRSPRPKHDPPVGARRVLGRDCVDGAQVKPDGGPAFPIGGTPCTERGVGMSLRDYFATAALQAIISGVAPHNMPAVNSHLSNGGTIDRAPIANTAYQYADAMLAERAK